MKKIMLMTVGKLLSMLLVYLARRLTDDAALKFADEALLAAAEVVHGTRTTVDDAIFLPTIATLRTMVAGAER